MKIFEIKSYDGISCEFVEANNERQALCNFLMNHPEYDDIMLYQSISGEWRLAPYDCKDEYLYAKLLV